MSRVVLQDFLAAVVYLGIAACATPTPNQRARMAELPLVAAHADAIFTLTTPAKAGAACSDATSCPRQEAADAAAGFAQRVQRVTASLQRGVGPVLADATRPSPEPAMRRFDVYVVVGDVPGSASSANGRIALNAAGETWLSHDAILAFVIAREMGHVLAHHHEENSAASIAASVLLNSLIPGSSVLKSALALGASGLAAKSQREVQALEADAIAFKLLAAAGYRLRDIAKSLSKASAPHDDGAWSKSFRTSSEHLLAQVGAAEFALASSAPETSAATGAGTTPDR